MTNIKIYTVTLLLALMTPSFLSAESKSENTCLTEALSPGKTADNGSRTIPVHNPMNTEEHMCHENAGP